MLGLYVLIPEIAGAKVAHDDIGANRLNTTRESGNGMARTGERNRSGQNNQPRDFRHFAEKPAVRAP